MSDVNNPSPDLGHPVGDRIRDARTFCAKNWWVYLLGGIAAIVFAILAFTKPGAAALVLGLFFAAFVLVDGVFSVIGALSNRDHDGWWLGLLYGILAIAVGGYLLAVPLAASMALVWTVAFIVILFGVTQVALGVRVRKAVKGEWMLYLTGVLSIIAGIMMASNIIIGGLTVVYLIAAWALLIGILRVLFALKARKFGQSGLV